MSEPRSRPLTYTGSPGKNQRFSAGAKSTPRVRESRLFLALHPNGAFQRVSVGARVSPNPTNTYSKTVSRAAQPRRDPRDARRLAPRCGGRLVCRAVAPFRVVKMRRRSFTPRFASKTIRSLAHFHSAGDEGMTLVGIWRAFAPAVQVAARPGSPPKVFSVG